jgi:hypothetical protein
MYNINNQRKIFFYQQFNVFKYLILKNFNQNKQKINNSIIYANYHNIKIKISNQSIYEDLLLNDTHIEEIFCELINDNINNYKEKVEIIKKINN